MQRAFLRVKVRQSTLAHPKDVSHSLVSDATSSLVHIQVANRTPLGVYLAQLRQFQQLPDYVDPTAPSEPVEVDPTGTLSPPLHPEVFATLAPLPESMTVEPLINVHKQRLIAGVVRDVVSGQHMARKYNHILDRRLQRECLRLRALDNVSAFLLMVVPSLIYTPRILCTSSLRENDSVDAFLLTL